MQKKLDEVIDDFEKACDLERKCEDCIGCLGQENGCPNDGAESIPDALHYLKEYRSEKAMWEADRKAYLDWIEQYKDAREKHQQAVIELKKNPPLTYDELKTMLGQPVWIEVGKESGVWLGEWCLVTQISDWMISTVRCSLEFWNVRKNTIGETWQAYRKERE